MTTLIPKVDLMNGATTPTGAINRPINKKLQDSVHVKDFGAIGDGTTDDTTAIQNAINYAAANKCELEITNGTYLVSTIKIENVVNFVIHGAASIIGKTTGTYDAVLEIKNTVEMTIHGRLAVSASFNVGYGAAIKVWQSGAGTTSYLMFDNVYVGNAQIGWQFGDTTQPDVVLSEITVKGGETYACAISVKAIGAETVINFIGTILISSYGSGTGAWLSLPRYIVYTVGAYVGVTSGEMLLVDSTTWVGVKVEPIASAVLGNIYGSVICVGVEFECASQYVVTTNPSALTPIAAVSAEASIRFIGCNGYHAGNFAALVTINADYNGSVVFNSNNFYAGVVRTVGNIDALGSGNTTCNIYCDAQSFGYNFVQGLNGQSGGIAHFDYRQIFESVNTNGLTLTAGTTTPLKYVTSIVNNDTNRYLSNYNVTTGIFTVPAGGLRSITVNASFKTSIATTAACDLALYVNGSLTQATNTMIGNALNSGYQRGVFNLGDLSAGTTFYVAATQYTTSGVTNGGALEHFTILARN
jgi:hypothetical protein